MSCLAVRRLLLAAPGDARVKLRTHLSGCQECTRLFMELSRLDRRVEEAARTPAPQGLAERLLLRHQRRTRRYPLAAAAAVVLVCTGAFLISEPLTLGDTAEPTLSAAAVGERHPAVQAISLVVDREPELLKQGRTGDPHEVEVVLHRLGLSLRAKGVTVQYVGKCFIGRGECEHLVLSTPHGFVTVFLVPGQPLSDRVLVADRRMVALASPAPAGGYIVVADSPNVAKRTEKLLHQH